MSELGLGDGVLMKAFKWHASDGFAVLSFNGPKPKHAYHLFMWLGVYADDAAVASNATADDRLNALGWAFNPELAAQAIEARRAATVKQGAVHESAVPQGCAPKEVP